MKELMVNWSREDEELLEPYEWDEFDDIEVIDHYSIYHVDNQTLYDCIYGCLVMEYSDNLTWLVGNNDYCIVIRFNEHGKLIARSLLRYQDRLLLQPLIIKEPISKFSYIMYDEGIMKEYGLTRNERIKKQDLEFMIEDLYYNDQNGFLSLCKQLLIHKHSSKECYYFLKEKLEKGYYFIHELLYNQLIKK